MKCVLGAVAALMMSASASEIHYVYNIRSELTRIMCGDEVLYGYEYDLAGNLKWSCVGCSTNVYETNCLNQYTTITDSEGNVYQFTYLFDGSLLVRETIKEIGGTAKQTEYIWGKDISGSLDGAGGVGGLLAVKIDGATYAPSYDVGGNITAYCSSSGSVVAERNYSPFGQMISARSDNDPLFRRLHFWFSTKYLDLETGLYYFGGRFYSPFLCRWLNRDPIGEQGGLNLYAFCRNDPINNYDPNGCAYFIKRKLDYLPWIKNFSVNANLDGKNLEFVHEHLV